MEIIPKHKLIALWEHYFYVSGNWLSVFIDTFF